MAAVSWLIDRGPRGVSRESARLDEWMQDIAPSTGLRKWFGHDPERRDEFRDRYFAELDAATDAVQQLRDCLDEGPVTLVYGARDETHNHAVALKQYLETRDR